MFAYKESIATISRHKHIEILSEKYVIEFALPRRVFDSQTAGNSVIVHGHTVIIIIIV